MNEGGTTLNPPTEAIQCVDVVLRQGTLQSYIKVTFIAYFSLLTAILELCHNGCSIHNTVLGNKIRCITVQQCVQADINSLHNVYKYIF